MEVAMKITFPQEFWWGAATSGPQSEGRFHKKHDNNFDYLFDTRPELFHDGVGPNVTSNFYNSYKEDITLLKSIGLNSIRTSIQWTRLIDDFETASINEEGARYYHDVIDAFLAQGIRPIINLNHFDMPYELEEKYGGWLSKHVIELYAKFAEKAFELYSDKVQDWFTFNEPIVVVECGYMQQFHYPMIVDGKKAMQVAFNMQVASAKAIAAFRRVNRNQKGRIGIILNLTPSYPRDVKNPGDLEAAALAELFTNRLFLDSSVLGFYPSELLDILKADGVLWQASDEEYRVIQENTVDYLGVNFYQPSRIKAPDISPNVLAMDWLPHKYYDGYQMPGRRMNMDRGWEIYPQALYDIGMRLKEKYNNIPWYVSENGIGVSREERYMDSEGVVHDDYRIQFVGEHLYHLSRAILEGSNCFGYHMWTPIDSWSWLNAYKNRYGFIRCDIRNQIKTVKKSGYWMKQIAESNVYDVPEEIIKIL